MKFIILNFHYSIFLRRTSILLLTILVMSGLVFPFTSQEATKQIFALSSFESFMQLYDVLNPTLRSKLISSVTDREHLFIEHMDLSRFHTDRWTHHLVEFYREIYSAHQIDLIISVNPPLFRCMLSGECKEIEDVIACPGNGEGRV